MDINELKEIVNRQIIEYKIADYDYYQEDWKYEDIFVQAFHCFQGDIGICGCGSPDDTYEEIMGFLNFCDWDDDYTEEQMIARHKFFEQPYAQFMAYVLDSLGYVDHGSCINGCFITDKGRDFLKMLKEEFESEEGIKSELFGECF